MIPRVGRGLAELNAVREQLERRLLGNEDYVALLALDRAICEFRDRSQAKVLAIFQRWASFQQADARTDETGDGSRPSPDFKGN